LSQFPLFVFIVDFATQDKVIQNKQSEVFETNKKLIRDFYNLPYYKRFGKRKSVNEKVQHNWFIFNLWMEKRVKIMSLENNNTLS